MDWFTGENLIALIKAVGYLGVFAIVFAESGLFVGFFLPGDSLLFTAGLLASQGFFDISALIFLVFVGAVLGDQVGYAFGKSVGPKLFKRENSLFFNKKNLVRARDFYEQYGVITIILARFIPIIRTFAPIVAGIGQMRYRTFVWFNVIGGLLWSLLLTLSGYYLVKVIPGIERYVSWIVIGIVIVSVVPMIVHFIKDKKYSK
jgi:membrane-associated protein